MFAGSPVSSGAVVLKLSQQLAHFHDASMPRCSWSNPKTVARPSPRKGLGVFTVAPIACGERITVWGGRAISAEDVAGLHGPAARQCVQVEEDLFLWTGDVVTGPGDLLNHSCDPNAGMAGEATVVAIRDIAADEEICIDYAMCDGSRYDEFPCRCGSRRCRGLVTGDDWRLPELVERYRGHFAPYLSRRIARIGADLKAPARHPLAVEAPSGTGSLKCGSRCRP
jgi:uncharacterized protein